MIRNVAHLEAFYWVFKLKSFKEEEINLEDVFMRITKGITN